MEYNQTRLIECDRTSSTNKSEDNPSIWTNNFNETIQLNAGDRVSVYSAFVSDRGSGQEKSVEFKGESFRKNKTIIKTQTTETLAFDSNSIDGTSYVERTTVKNVPQSVEMYDNKSTITIQYYKNMDLRNYHQLPRLGFTMDPSSAGSASYNTADSVLKGRVNFEPYPINMNLRNTYGYVIEDFTGLTTDQGDGTDPRLPVTSWIQKNDNSRYTIMTMNGLYGLRHNTTGLFSDYAPETVDRELLPQYYEQDPEFFSPVILNENIDLEIQKGMSDASYVGEEISRQLQESRVEPTLYTTENPVGATGVLKAQPTQRTIQSNTYKLFTSTSAIGFDTALVQLNILNNATVPTGGEDVGMAGTVFLSESPGNPLPNSGTQLLLQVGANPDTLKQNVGRTIPYYQFKHIAIKRPELYEKGCRLNPYLFGNTLDPNLTPADGIRLNGTAGISLKEKGMVINMPYHKDYLLRMKEFVEAQELYPELFSNENIYNLESDTERTYTKKGTATYDPTQYFISVDNQRYFYMNVHQINGVRNTTSEDPRCYLQHSDRRNNMRNTHNQFFTQLGNSFYNWRGTWQNPATGNVEYNTYFADSFDMKSRPFFFHYDKTQKNIFYDEPADDVNWNENPALTYGFIGKKALTHPANNLPQGTYVELKNLTGDKAQYNGKIAQVSLVDDVYPANPTGYLVRPDDPDILTGRGNEGLGFRVSETEVIPLPVCVIYPNRVLGDGGNPIGIPTYFSSDDTVLTQGTKIGFDRHYNAWATNAIILSDGLGESYYPTEFQDYIQPFNSFTTAGADARPTLPTAFNSPTWESSQIYQGADRPTLSFDGEHFSFSFLHTPLNKGALVNSETTITDTSSGDIVYKMNPVQDYDNYGSVQLPYEAGIPFRYKSDTGTELKNKYFPLNINVEPYAIYDGSTGIFISDWGITKAQWDDSLWGRLGFSYNQLNNEDVAIKRQLRMEGENATTNILTTNCDTPVLDTKSFAQNQFYVSKVNGQVMRTSLLNLRFDSSNPDVTTAVPFFPRIIQRTTSYRLIADDYPLSMFKGYYAVRADLVVDSFTAGGDNGNTNLPVVGIVDKMNPKGDFFFGSESSISYMITKNTPISSITIGITDPDGSWASISKRSSVIFRVDRPSILNTNIVNQVQEDIEERVRKLRKQS